MSQFPEQGWPEEADGQTRGTKAEFVGVGGLTCLAVNSLRMAGLLLAEAV